MPNFRIVSDLHLEINPTYKLPVIEGEENSVLLLAGDICDLSGKLSKYDEFFENICSRFQKIIWVLGNHEYYRGSIINALEKYKEYFKDFKNLNITNKGVFEIEDCVVIAATLWTDLKKGDPFVKFVIREKMNDYHCIRTGSIAEPWLKKLHPNDTYVIHFQHVNFITQKLEEFSNKRKIVVTHHAPCHLSVDEKFRDSDVNAAYYSDLSELIFKYSPDLWIHGHMHDSFEYNVYDTKVICNPKGYGLRIDDGNEVYQNKSFDPRLLIEF